MLAEDTFLAYEHVRASLLAFLLRPPPMRSPRGDSDGSGPWAVRGGPIDEFTENSIASAADLIPDTPQDLLATGSYPYRRRAAKVATAPLKSRIRTARTLMATRYLFVDGGYLREVARQFAEEFFGPEVVIAIDHARVGAGFRKCFYYDCPAPRRRGEAEADYAGRIANQRARFSSIRMLDGWHVTEGVMVGQGANARQKQIDIQIAVDMLSHSHRRNMDELDFIAGDQDFKPLLEALVRDGMYVRLIYEPKSASEALIESADAQRKINVYDVAYTWATDEFRKAYSLPNRVSYAPGPRRITGVLSETGAAPFGNVELWTTQTGFAIKHPDRINTSHSVHWTHHDKDFLKKVFAHMEGETTWTAAPEAGPPAGWVQVEA